MPGRLQAEKLAGQAVAKTGNSASTTVIVNEHAAVNPYASVTRKEFTVVPTGKKPLLGNPCV
jgi:hypothetical protein